MPPAAKKTQPKIDRDAAEVAAQPDPELDAPGVEAGDGGLCKIHFPRGWDSPAAFNHVTKDPYPAVTCEHGHYVRPAETDDAPAVPVGSAPGQWRVLDPSGAVVASGEAVQTAVESGLFAPVAESAEIEE